MAEYIKRIDVMKICESYSEHCFNSSDAKGQDIADRILDDVVEIPTANVEVVRHGEWLQDPEDCYGGDYICSICGNCADESYLGSNSVLTNYCSKCGAKMDGGKAE